MKKVLLTLMAAALVSTASFAQKANIESLKSSAEKSKADTQNEKKGAKASTWISYAEDLYDLAAANSSSIYHSMSENEIILLVGKPGPGGDGSYSVEEYNGVEYKKFSYPRVDLYLADDKLSFWNELEVPSETALSDAVAAYKKAIELDAKSKDKAVTGLKRIMDFYINEANNKYMMNNFSAASEMFLKGGEVAVDPVVEYEGADEYKYFGGVAAVQGEVYGVACEVFSDLIAKGYVKDGDTYYYLGYAYEQNKDMAKAEETYLAGASAYPANQKVLNQLINYYIVSGDNPEKVIPFIKKAQESNPDDYIMIFVEGIAYQNMKEFEKAHDAYARTKMAKSDFFDVFYNNSLVYISQADAVIGELDTIDATNRKLYSEKLDTAIEFLKLGLAEMEAGFAINSESKDILELMKSTSFRLRDVDDSYLEKYNKYNDMLKAM